jgi:hypothetical protein
VIFYLVEIFTFQSAWEGSWTETNEPTSGGMLIVDIINGRFINNLQESRRNITKGPKS